VLDYEWKLQIWDITITIVLFIIGCVAGKLMTIYASDTWFSFNGPAIGILFIGELIWWRVRKRLIKKRKG